jgi:AcrR family transcriptional regulator
MSSNVRKRRKRGELSREWLVGAALDIVDSEGLESLTMRRLAEKAGCGLMSVYSYVRDRADLLGAIVERLLSEIDFHAETGDTWAAVLRRAAQSYAAMYDRHPSAFPLVANVSATDPTMSTHLLNVTSALSSTGISVNEAFAVISIVDAFATGVFLGRVGEPAGDDGEVGGISSGLDPWSDRLRGMVGDEVWRQGLEAIIVGVQKTLGLPPAS